jgi:hypothetical protein
VYANAGRAMIGRGTGAAMRASRRAAVLVDAIVIMVKN